MRLQTLRAPAEVGTLSPGGRALGAEQLRVQRGRSSEPNLRSWEASWPWLGIAV